MSRVMEYYPPIDSTLTVSEADAVMDEYDKTAVSVSRKQCDGLRVPWVLLK